MAGFGALIVALGIIGIIYGIMQKMKAGRVADAPFVKTGEIAAKGASVAGPKGAVSAEGNVVCQQPLTSPMTGVPCLYYQIKCTARWKEGDTQKSKEIHSEKVAAQFAIDDGTGPVWVDAREGGDFEPSDSRSDTKKTGLIGAIAGQDLMFGNFKVSTGMLSLGTEYQVEEKVFPMQQRIYACGKLSEGNPMITAPGWRALILSNKTRDELLGAATKGAKNFLIGGAVACVVGTALGVVGTMMSSGNAAADAGAASSAAASGTAKATTPAGAAKPVAPAKAPAKPAATAAPKK